YRRRGRTAAPDAAPVLPNERGQGPSAPASSLNIPLTRTLCTCCTRKSTFVYSMYTMYTSHLHGRRDLGGLLAAQPARQARRAEHEGGQHQQAEAYVDRREERLRHVVEEDFVEQLADE